MDRSRTYRWAGATNRGLRCLPIATLPIVFLVGCGEEQAGPEPTVSQSPSRSTRSPTSASPTTDSTTSDPTLPSETEPSATPTSPEPPAGPGGDARQG